MVNFLARVEVCVPLTWTKFHDQRFISFTPIYKPVIQEPFRRKQMIHPPSAIRKHCGVLRSNLHASRIRSGWRIPSSLWWMMMEFNTGTAQMVEQFINQRKRNSNGAILLDL